MAEGGGSCPCNGAKKKTGVFKLFKFIKKKKKTTTHDHANCPQCLQKKAMLNPPPYTMDACIEKERRMMSETKIRRKEPAYVELPPERKRLPIVEENTYDEIAEYSVPSPVKTERGIVAVSSSGGIATTPASGSRILEGGAAAEGIIDETLMKMPLKYHPPRCNCPPCKKKQYDDGLLAMDAQVILQNSLLQSTLTDTAGLVCVIL